MSSETFWRVVKLEADNGSKPRFAIQLTSGAYYGQEWLEDRKLPTKQYPTWPTRKAAEKKVQSLGLETVFPNVIGRALFLISP